MEIFKKVLSLILILSIMMCSFSSCISVSAQSYMLKGEFFNTYLKYFNFTPENATFDEMDEADDYSIEADTILDWGLLSEDDATKNLEKPITREIAILCCLKAINIKEQGNIDDIKDADLCDYPQEMADAYANGIVDLKNGYIDCKEKLTFDECEEMLERTMKAIATSHYGDGSGSVTYGDADVILDELSDGEEISLIDVANSSELQQYLNTDEKLAISYLSKKDDVDVTQVNRVDNIYVFKINEKLYQSKFAKLKYGVTDGDIVTIRSFEKIYSITDDTDIIGRYVNVLKYDLDSYCITIDTSIPDEEKMAATKVEKVGKKIANLNFEQLETEVGGFNISLSGSGDKATFKVTKKFKMSEATYNNWRDATETTTATFEATIGNIYISTNNVEGFFKSGNSGDDNPSFKLTCDTTEKFTFGSASMRLAPDSNRNGKFLSNLTKSRFTDGKGAESIKIGKAHVIIPNTGISLDIYAYLCITLSGKISIEFGQVGHGYEVTKINGKIHTNYLKASDKNSKLEIQSEYDVGVKINALVNFLCIKNVISGYVQGGVKGSGSIYVYGEDDPVERTSSSKVLYCMNFIYAVYVRAGLNNDNLIGKVANRFGYDMSKVKMDITAPSWGLPAGNLHYEETGKVPECTRELGYMKNEEENTDANSENDKFIISNYALNIPAMTCGTVYITRMPITEKELEKKYPKGIQVKVKDASVAKAVYLEKNNIIMVEAVNPGSTIVEVFVKKNKKTGKEYAQTFAVNVSGDYTSTFVSYISPNIQEVYLYTI